MGREIQERENNPPDQQNFRGGENGIMLDFSELKAYFKTGQFVSIHTISCAEKPALTRPFTKVARHSIFVGASSNFDPPSSKQLDSNYTAITTHGSHGL